MRFKDLYDQDNDGKLNREEQLRWIAPNSYGSAREEVRLDCSNACPDFVDIIDEMNTIFLNLLSCHQQALHLLKEMDHDGDGQISEAEVLKNQETFMNSEVTDYGRQLHVLHDEF